MSGETPPTCLNSEEQDQLDRSTKKTKTSTESPMGEAIPQTAATGMVAPAGTLSFKQVVANESGHTEQRVVKEIDLVSDDEEEADDDVDPHCPIIRVTREEKVRLRSKWKQTLIVKVMGRNVGYGYLLRRLTSLWKPKARMELVTVDNGYFLVKFASIDNYEFAKYGGPWMVLDHYLIVKEWMPNFDPFTAKTESMIVWIRFPCLPSEYFDRQFLLRVGEKVGRPINIDTATSLVSRASFARVCVEVDITKPLLAKFTLKNRVRPIVYEGLHLICFKCGMYGHSVDGCSLNRKEDITQQSNMDGGGRPENSSGEGNGTEEGMHGKRNTHMETTIIRPEVTEDYGSWMIAPKHKRNYTKNQGNKNQGGKDYGKKDQNEAGRGNQTSVQSGSRYASLAENLEEENEQTTEEPIRDQSASETQAQGQKKTGQSKGKRQTTQVSEKQINGNNKHGLHKKYVEVGESSSRKNLSRKTTGTQANQEGAASEHTLVMGDKTGSTSVRVFESETGTEGECMTGAEILNEHHEDPPDDGQLEGLELMEDMGEKNEVVASDGEAMELEL
ncbi:uncharacterized protein LOC116026940 [Ipomoea triloba]|uniref:uncharacterized protein LOC116026940 n=1 Tax=Ipomoea triloba TaxID=35885 RepID=UPI00125E6A5D|nr:uncharacterized protein LOC116026940 [Ipomoea triloba]